MRNATYYILPHKYSWQGITVGGSLNDLTDQGCYTYISNSPALGLSFIFKGPWDRNIVNRPLTKVKGKFLCVRNFYSPIPHDSDNKNNCIERDHPIIIQIGDMRHSITQQINTNGKSKIGCIEMIGGRTNIHTGAVDSDNDGIKESWVTIESITGSDKQYLKYDCQGCSPVPDFSWLSSLKYSSGDYLEFVRAKTSIRLAGISFLFLSCYLIFLLGGKKVK